MIVMNRLDKNFGIQHKFLRNSIYYFLKDNEDILQMSFNYNKNIKVEGEELLKRYGLVNYLRPRIGIDNTDLLAVLYKVEIYGNGNEDIKHCIEYQYGLQENKDK